MAEELTRAESVINTTKGSLHARKRKTEYLAFLDDEYPDQPEKWKLAFVKVQALAYAEVLAPACHVLN